MEKNEPRAYWALLGLTAAFSILAVITLLPNGAASKPNVLGYRSVCSFAPAASAVCGLLAGLTCTFRNRRFSRRAASMRYRPLIVPLGVGLVLLVIVGVFGTRFGRVQAGFGAMITRSTPAPVSLSTLPDGTRRATTTDGDVSATVEITVAGGHIDSMRLAAGRNVDAALAEKIFSRVKAAGSLEVDAVSGATASSRVLLKAIAAAAAP